MPPEFPATAPVPLTKAQQRSDHALRNMLDNLEELNCWVNEVDRERAEAMEQRGNLKMSIEAMLRAVPYEVTRRHAERYARLGARADTPARERKGPMGEVIRFLYENDFPTVRGAELMRYLEAIGVDVNPRYAGKALFTLAAEGMLTRTAHGVYAINHGHPELVAQRLEMMERRRYAPGSRAAPDAV